MTIKAYSLRLCQWKAISDPKNVSLQKIFVSLQKNFENFWIFLLKTTLNISNSQRLKDYDGDYNNNKEMPHLHRPHITCHVWFCVIHLPLRVGRSTSPFYGGNKEDSDRLASLSEVKQLISGRAKRGTLLCLTFRRTLLWWESGYSSGGKCRIHS